MTKQRTRKQLLKIAKRLKLPVRSADRVCQVEQEIRTFLNSHKVWDYIAGRIV